MAKCARCGDVIESTYVHDYVQCSCGAISVDGGHAYCKRGFVYSYDDIIDLSEWEEVPDDKESEPR